MKTTIITILVGLLIIETGFLISAISNLEPGQDLILTGRTSQVFNEDGDNILPQSSTKNLGDSSTRFLNIFSSELNCAGTTTIATRLMVGTTTEIGGDLDVWDTSSTTVNIGSASAPGCLIIGDSDGGGVTYITVLDGVIATSTTNPGTCK